VIDFVENMIQKDQVGGLIWKPDLSSVALQELKGYASLLCVGGGSLQHSYGDIYSNSSCRHLCERNGEETGPAAEINDNITWSDVELRDEPFRRL